MNEVELVETKSCPVCGGSRREITQSMAVGEGKELQGRYYLKPAAAELGLSLDELTEQIKAHRCLSCGNYFCDPWFSPELASRLFCVSAPDHLYAWGNFENWLHRHSPAQDRMQALLDIVTEITGPVTAYAEFGCPFQGFLMHFKGIEADPSERLKLFSKALNRQVDQRWSTITRFYNGTQRLNGRVAVFCLRLRGVLVRIHNLIKTRSLRNRLTSNFRGKIKQFPAKRYLLTRDTTLGWGSNCVRFGATCRYFAHTVLDADVIPMGEIHRGGPPSFDLIGIFNSLDHTSGPLDIVRSALEMADHVLLVTHRAALAGKQHLYAFSDEFSVSLNQLLDGVSINDVSSVMGSDGKDFMYVMISRK